ncbi:MAG: hypothetical protein M3277_04095 [Actinomycetota bacterium]|nr:hypothetical protein [Actinomycetota bacterium]
MTRWKVALVLCLAMFACDDQPAESEQQERTTPLVSNETDGCDNQEAAIDSGWLDQETELQADFDGDGQQDIAHLVLDESGDPGCRAFLVARTATTEGSEPVWKKGAEGGLPEPRLNSVVEMNGQPGLEILVDEISGASTQFVGAFAFVDSTLERVEAPESTGDIWSGASEGVFPYGGTVGHIEGADCHDDDGIVVSAALPAGPAANTYVVARRFFDVEGAELVLRDTKRSVATAEEVFDDYPEFRASPFGSCSSN